jgi:hypothetical protein
MRTHPNALVFVVCVIALFTVIGFARTDVAAYATTDGIARGEGLPDRGEAPQGIEAPFYFGTLLTDASRADQEAAAGVGVVHLEIGWDVYEPANNAFNAGYANQIRGKLETFRAAGLRVVLGVGLQYPPAWVRNNPVTRVHQDLGLNNFHAVRIGSGGYVETFYPDEFDGTHGNSYWAYDQAAQTGADLPPSIPVNPFPGWQPGQTTYNSQPFTTAQVGQWYDWYVSALADGVNWQIARYKALGFTGYIHLLMPGQGVRPNDYDLAITNYLNGAGNGNRTMGRGAVWNKIIDKLTDRQNVVAYVSSMADGSGWNDHCQPGDASVPLNDPRIYLWSATRWVSYNADRYGMLKNGENPARGHGSGYGVGMMQTTAAQMASCGLMGIMWAHDANLYDGTSGVTLQNYADLIAQYNGSQATPTPPPVTPTPDPIPPTVHITHPPNGSTVPVWTVVPITATATDNVGVTRVDFYVNSNLRCSDTTAPFQCNWRVPRKANVAYTLNARAYDAAGNTASSTVTVTSQ